MKNIERSRLEPAAKLVRALLQHGMHYSYVCYYPPSLRRRADDSRKLLISAIDLLIVMLERENASLGVGVILELLQHSERGLAPDV